MSEPQKHHAKGKKLDTKGHRLYDSTGKMSRTGKPMETESRLVVIRVWKTGKQGVIIWCTCPC